MVLADGLGRPDMISGCKGEMQIGLFYSKSSIHYCAKLIARGLCRPHEHEGRRGKGTGTPTGTLSMIKWIRTRSKQSLVLFMLACPGPLRWVV